MYYGKMTEELEELYKKYNEKWGVEPDFYEETEYGDTTYEDYLDYVNDIKKALELGVTIPQLYPLNDDDDD
jgi:thiaminase